jgi:hypothetical protein
MKNLFGNSHEEYVNSVRELVQPSISLADATLIAVKGNLKLYRLPNGVGVILNGDSNETVAVNIGSVLSHDGYWTQVNNHEQE